MSTMTVADVLKPGPEWEFLGVEVEWTHSESSGWVRTTRYKYTKEPSVGGSTCKGQQA